MKVKIRNKSTPKTRQDKVGFFRAFTDLFQYFLSYLFPEIRGETKEKKPCVAKEAFSEILCRVNSFSTKHEKIHKTLIHGDR